MYKGLVDVYILRAAEKLLPGLFIEGFLSWDDS